MPLLGYLFAWLSLQLFPNVKQLVMEVLYSGVLGRVALRRVQWSDCRISFYWL